ncbi:glucose-6-phosphate isomerase [Leptospira ognonensis]|uniref:Glucose-6-phosphate isomerase n=1 Tax=Leptospira ognonensis TaxID=2484945 RepID=A0A4R9JX95_9LEPT|nr:glucose-6-phosphate isomerase [Leptospira ognonensis]TGL56208.1 glucose-6-phosphate isomerase [Leptospira ognonensis]
MTNLTFNDRFAKRFVPENLLQEKLSESAKAMQTLLTKSGAGNEFLGWVDLPSQITSEELQRVREAAESIQKHSEYLVVIGIGGSYLGARAIIEALSSPFQHLEPSKKGVTILYAGHHLDSDYHAKLLAFLENKNFSINVISKSGTTTEPAIAFRLLLSLLERKYGKQGLKNRVFSTTDRAKGALKKLSDEYGFETFTIPDDVGGRYSFLTPVGLLPIAAAGFSINQLVDGAKTMEKNLKANVKPEDNLACRYASYRNALYFLGKKTEVMVSYQPNLSFVMEWWKQLFGESEGKGGKGIFPASVQFTTDLHSMGQYLQDGERTIFETVIQVDSAKADVYLTEKPDDSDGLNYLAGKKLLDVTKQAILGTLVAHSDGNVPCLELNVSGLNEEILGQLLYFFEFTCGISGYMLGVNPFDQPGVEDYKNNMFALLGKNGFEERKKQILAHLK